MFGKAISFGSLLLLAGALALVTPNCAQAQHRGGGHGGGFHPGGSRGHVSGSFQGGYHHAYPYGGNWGYRHYYPHHGHWGHRYYYYPYYGGYGTYPYYYPYYPSYYDTYPYYWSAPAYDFGNDDYSGRLTPSYSDGNSVASTLVQPDNTAHITIRVPPDATIWFDNTKTTPTGSIREFHSPALTSGTQYSYEVRADWYESGQEVTQTQRVPVTAGAHVSVTFPVEPAKADTAPTNTWPG